MKTHQKLSCDFSGFGGRLAGMSSGDIYARHFATGEPMHVRWQNGIITAWEPAAEAKTADLWLAPGLIDLQINGYGGLDFQQDDLSVEDILSASRQLRADGCTRFLLTLITDDWSKLTARLKHLKKLCSQSPELQGAIVGWHIEGPFLSGEPGFHGAHNPKLMLDPKPEHIRELRSIVGDDLLLLTIAPERKGALEAIELATALKIKISLGHTNASAELLQRAVKAGATMFTHLGNGCPRELDRHDNILWRVLETPGLMASLIPDQIHVSPALFRLLHKSTGDNSIYYTTDAMAAAGAPVGSYTLGAVQVEVGDDQIVRQPGKSNFAGSALKPIDGIFRAAKMLGVPWQQVWKRFSEIPAQLMGLPGVEWKVGQPADFCIVSIDGKNELRKLQVASR